MAKALGRILLVLGLLALIVSWVAGTSIGKAFLGIGQTTWFVDAIVFALLGIGALIDGAVKK